MAGFYQKIIWGDGIAAEDLGGGVIRVTAGAAGAGQSPPTRQVVTATGTYTLPAGCRAILVECIGGGGAGGGTPATAASGNGQTAAGGGGGGGAYAASLITSPSSSYSVTVGAGGTGVSGAAGNNGANTTFGSTIVVADAGLGGGVGVVDVGVFPDPSGAAARGGLASNCTGDVNLTGGHSGSGRLFRAAYPAAGQGGGAARGGAPRLATPENGTFTGNAGNQYGGGGTGASAIASAAAQKGGDGAAGVIVVTEFY